MKRRTVLAGLAGSLALAPTMFSSTKAQTPKLLRIASQSPPSGMDPHYHNANSNNAVLKQIFNPLIDINAKNELLPCLAEKWRVMDELTWELSLRPGVTFHDGTPFEAEDIKFNFERALKIPNSPGGFTPFVRNITDVKVVDPKTVHIKTRDPNPFLDWDLTFILMLSRTIHAGSTLADFNSGKAMIGTGAYKHVSYQLGEQHEIASNPQFWGGKTAWDRVVTRFVTNPGSRVAALLAGDVDLIDAVGAQDIPRLTADPRTSISSGDSSGVAYLFPDSVRDVSPFVADKQGKPLSTNPLKQLKVRQALSLSINRAGIIERLLSGQGTPADQFAAPSAVDRLEGLPPLPLDIVRAKKLLAEAGYPDGFQLTIHGPSGWFAGDNDVLQAVAQGFNRIGVETKVEVLPAPNLFTRATNREFSMFMTTFASSLTTNSLRQVIMTHDPATGAGPFNRQRYSNSNLDKPLAEALRTMDPARRKALTGQAMRAAMDDVAVIPIFNLRFSWGTRKSYVKYEANPGWYTSALFAEPVGS